MKGYGQFCPVAKAAEIVAELTGQEPNVIRHEQPPGDVRDSAADIAAATRWLDYGPAVSLEEGLRRQWEWTLAERDPVGAPPYRSG